MRTKTPIMTGDDFKQIQKKLKMTNKDTAEAIDTELFTVQMWRADIWTIPRPIAKFLRVLLEIKRNSGPGYEEGYNDGWNKGYTRGYDKGYNRGIDWTGTSFSVWHS